MSKEKRRAPAPNPIKALLFQNKHYAPPESFPVYHTMREMLERNAAVRPDDVAFQYLKGRKEMVSHTYAEFYQTVVYLGTYMLKRGIRGRKIALVGENSYEWLLCYFAIVTTGNVAVLVAKDATPAEASTLIFQSEADVVVTSRKYPYEKELLAQKLVKNKYCFSMREFDEWEEKASSSMKRAATCTTK